jgi:hypothetical protein
MRLIEWAGGIVAVLGALSAVFLAGQRLWKFVRLSVHAFETIVGTPEKAGKPGSGMPGMADRLDSVEKELRPNGGGSLRDVVDTAAKEARVAAAGVVRLEATTEDLRSHAESSGEGIADLRDQANDLGRRLTDLDERVESQGERITDHRRRNDETIDRIKQFLEGEHRDALIAREALQASVTELLHMPDETDQPGAS